LNSQLHINNHWEHIDTAFSKLKGKEGVNERMNNKKLQEVASDSSLKNNLDRLTIETLRSLCSAEGLSETGNKKNLAECFAMKVTNKIKGKEIMNVDDSWQSDEDRYVNQYADNLRKDF
ncbi:6945_t:CDS:2, partial [Racocetra persica]